MKRILFLPLLLVYGYCAAQFAIGETTYTFNDPDRTGGTGSGGGPGRQIETLLFYPAQSAGQDSEFAEGGFPVLVLGHGFLMTTDAYLNLVDLLVPEGYIVALPNTEGGLAPSHGDFGLDMVVIGQSLQEMNEENGSPFFQHIQPQMAVGGHSMGGGASVLASAEGLFQAYLGLAPAETNPSAIAAAAQSSIPALIFSGSADGVTPPADHQIPIFNAWGGACKLWVDIQGGGHCFFANSSATCDFGELFTSGGITLTREEQQGIMNSYALPWLDFWLKGEGSFATISAALESDGDVNFELECENPVGVAEQGSRSIRLFPNPASEYLMLEGEWPLGARVQIVRPDGRMQLEEILQDKRHQLEIREWGSGIYVLRIFASEGGPSGPLLTTRFVKR